jgi:hypothetical protein
MNSVQTVSLHIFIYLKQFYFAVSGLKIIGHGNPDNNLESYILSCCCFVKHLQCSSLDLTVEWSADAFNETFHIQ